MALKRILAVHAGNAHDAGGLRIALTLAKTHGAALTGLAVLGPTRIEDGYRHLLDRGIREIIADRDSAAVAEIRARFEAGAADTGIGDTATFLSHAAGEEGFAELSHGFDLIVYCDHPLDDERSHLPQTVSDLLLAVGCPLLFIPDACSVEQIDGPVLLAWDGRRAAARAIGDALHLGLLHDGVVVFEARDEGPQPPATRQILDRLSAHGIQAAADQQTPGRRSIAELLLDAAAAGGAQMIVMGAYQHSRLRERIIGGVTEDMLAQRRIPVLFSH